MNNPAGFKSFPQVTELGTVLVTEIFKSVVSSLTARNESEVAQSCPTLCDPMGCSIPGSSVHGILQARILE